MAFQRIVNQRSHTGEPCATLSARGAISFNNGALALLNPQGHKRVSIFIDCDIKQIGFLFGPDEDYSLTGGRQTLCAKLMHKVEPACMAVYKTPRRRKGQPQGYCCYRSKE